MKPPEIPDAHRRSRRDLLKLAALAPLAGLAGCVQPLPDEVGISERSGKLEVRAFQGGYGIDFYEKAAREFEAAHPGVEIDLAGDPRIWEQLRPRFVGGEPPGLTFPGWGMDHYALIYEGQALPLDDALLTTPYGKSKGTWRDSFIPDLLKLGSYQGQTYLLPFYVNLNGWWYNANLFQENGWKAPSTFEELLPLCAEIRAKGIDPITYQGKYPAYTVQGFLIPWAISVGGIDAYHAAERLEPGAWKSEAFLQSARMLIDLKKKGYLDPSANGLSHTESQIEFVNGRAAMIPCGTWLESEMKKQTPKGFRMEFIPPPHLKEGKGDPTTIQVGVEPWLIPSKGKNPALAIEFFKYLTSEEKAREFVQQKGSLTAIRKANEGELPATLRAPARALAAAKTTWTMRLAHWYKPLNTALETAMAALLQEQFTPEQFVDEVEKAATKVRNDPNVPKHSRSRMTHGLRKTTGHSPPEP